jgi:hypothetical protein
MFLANHVKGYHITEGDLPSLERLHKVSVHDLWAATGRQAEHKRSLRRRSKRFYAFYPEISITSTVEGRMNNARTMYCAMYSEAWSALSLMISLLRDD